MNDSLEEEQEKMIEIFYGLFHDKEFKSHWQLKNPFE